MREVLLCDADGNLFPSEEPAFEVSAQVTNRFLEAIGADDSFTAEELRRGTTGKNFRTTARDLARAADIAVEPAELERWVEEERRVVTAHLAAVLRPDPAVTGPLERLAGRYRLAAVSSSARKRVEACVAAAGLGPLFPSHFIYSAEDSLPSPRSKPDPAIYRFALDDLGASAGDCLAVEDSVPGVESAVAAGIETIGNIQFVPPSERAMRAQALAAAGASGIVRSWAELAREPRPEGGSAEAGDAGGRYEHSR